MTTRTTAARLSLYSVAVDPTGRDFTDLRNYLLGLPRSRRSAKRRDEIRAAKTGMQWATIGTNIGGDALRLVNEALRAAGM